MIDCRIVQVALTDGTYSYDVVLGQDDGEIVLHALDAHHAKTMAQQLCRSINAHTTDDARWVDVYAHAHEADPDDDGGAAWQSEARLRMAEGNV